MEKNLIKLIIKENCIIKIRDGRLLFLNKCNDGQHIFLDKNFKSIVLLTNYNDDLTSKINSKYNIMEVYHPYSLAYMNDISILKEKFMVWSRVIK